MVSSKLVFGDNLIKTEIKSNNLNLIIMVGEILDYQIYIVTFINPFSYWSADE